MSERTSSRRQPYAPNSDADADLHRAIDRVYDKAETFVSGLGRALGVDTSGAVARSAQVSDGAAATLPTANPVRALPAVAEPFQIVEVMDGDRVAAYLVTNGRESARCESRAIAEAVLDHLQKALAK